MIRSSMTTAALVLSWTVSPDALSMFGNYAGQSGMMFAIPLAIGLLVSSLAIILIYHPTMATTNGSFFAHLAKETGLLPAMTLTLASRLCLVLLLPTGMLVTAGFSFNETFLYWFPNFAFSFLLLGIILILHLANDRLALALQPVCIGLTIGCLLLLSFAGFFLSHELLQETVIPGKTFPQTLPFFFTAFLFFLGYDHQGFSPAGDNRPFIWSVLGGFILLVFWGFACLRHVPQAILANSTIPSIISAREILGEPGRIIMGIAVISGTCALVNGLFLLAGRSLAQMTDHLFLQSTVTPASRWKSRQGKIWPVIFALFIGIFMATGLAGSKKLEIYIYGALLIWLLMTGAYCFAAARTLQKVTGRSIASWYLLSALFPLAALWLACVDEHAVTLVVFCFFVLAASGILSSGWLWYDKKTTNRKIKNSQGDIS